MFRTSDSNLYKLLILLNIIFFLLIPSQSFADNSKRQRYLKRRAALQEVRIIGIAAYDQGDYAESATSDMTLDTEQLTCEDDSDEVFFGTLAALSIVNDSPRGIQINSIRYVVKKGLSNGKRYRAPKLAAIGNQQILAGETGRIVTLFLDTEDGRKYYAGHTEPIDTELGFRNVKFIVRGRDFSGRRFRIKAKAAFSFGLVDRCD